MTTTKQYAFSCTCFAGTAFKLRLLFLIKLVLVFFIYFFYFVLPEGLQPHLSVAAMQDSLQV